MTEEALAQRLYAEFCKEWQRHALSTFRGHPSWAAVPTQTRDSWLAVARLAHDMLVPPPVAAP